MASSSFITVARPFTSFATYTHSPSICTKTTTLGLRRNSFKVKAIATKYEPTQVKPQADRVLIRLEELPQQSAGGVLLPKSAVKFERYLMGEILAVGTEVGDLEAGKKVLFSDVNAYEVDLGAEGRHCFCKASDLLAIVIATLGLYLCCCSETQDQTQQFHIRNNLTSKMLALEESKAFNSRCYLKLMYSNWGKLKFIVLHVMEMKIIKALLPMACWIRTWVKLDVKREY